MFTSEGTQTGLVNEVSKSGAMNFNALGNGTVTAKNIEQARASVLWGCTAWDGWNAGLGNGVSIIAGTDVSRYENGYSMNYWPTMTAGYPAIGASLPPPSESQMRTTAISIGTPQGPAVGAYYKINDWKQASEKMLLIDANLW